MNIKDRRCKDHRDFLKSRKTWIPVNQELPPENTDVLVVFENVGTRISSWFQWETMENRLWHPGISGWGKVTHWMPLPALPEAEPWRAKCKYAYERKNAMTDEQIAATPHEVSTLQYRVSAVIQQLEKECTELRRENDGLRANLEDVGKRWGELLPKSIPHKYASSNEQDVCACGLPRTHELHFSVQVP